MIAPEPEEEIKYTGLRVLLRNNLLVCTLIFAALEIWRPYFFLTDDNLDGGLPFFIEMGHHLLAGQSPFVTDHLFGGGYNLLRDPDFFLWHPLYLLASLLAATPFRFMIVDADAFAFFLIATAGFVTLADYLRRDLPLKISDGWIMFYTVSFTYSLIALATGASWLNFLGNHSALPWLALGILQRTWPRGLGLVTLAALHQILAGHVAPTVSTDVFFTLFAVGISLSRRSFLPMASWFLGYSAAVIVASPVLLPMLHGFFASWRSHGVTLDDMQLYNLSLPQFFPSLFTGAALWMVVHADGPPHSTYTITLGAFIAAWCLLPAMVSRAKWRGLELVALAMTFFCALLIIRPLWISEIMLHLPVFRSMRWPFRELLEFQFFINLFLLVRPPGLSPRQRQLAAWWGTFIVVVPLLLNPLRPTFNTTAWDRDLILHGGFNAYWAQVRPLLRPGDRIAVLIPESIHGTDSFDEPYSLLASYNFAIMAGVINASGYSPTAPLDQLYTRTCAHYPFGAYVPEQKAALLAERPDLTFITLESINPLKITLSSRAGPPVDLTPFVPPRTDSRP